MQIAAAYVRVSTDEQIEYSPDSQLKAIREYAKRCDMILLDEFIFLDEGISGRTTGKRPAFMRMIATAKQKPKPFDTILLWKFSRFARNREDSVVFKSLLRKQCGIDVVSVSENIGEDKTSILIEALLEAMDEYYSINLAEEVKRGMTEKASRGEVVSTPPFGYDIKDNIFVTNPDTAPLVAMIFGEFLDGRGCREIAMNLNAMGAKSKRGNKWENRTVQYILNNPVYIGKLRWTPSGRFDRVFDNPDTIITQGLHEAIISVEMWEETQLQIAKNKKRYPKYARTAFSEIMLQGLVRCSNCGSTLTQALKNKSLQCHSYAKGSCKVSHSISLKKINKAVLETIESDMTKPAFNIEFTKSKKTCCDSHSLIESEKRRLYRVKHAYESGVDSLEEYRVNKEKITKRMEELQQKVLPFENTKQVLTEFRKKVLYSVTQLRSAELTENEKNAVLRTFVTKIIYSKYSDEISIFYYL